MYYGGLSQYGWEDWSWGDNRPLFDLNIGGKTAISWTVIMNFNIITNKPNLAFTYGYFKPEVYISKNFIKELNRNEFNALLEHELSHKNSYDPLMMLIMLFIKELLPLTFVSNY